MKEHVKANVSKVDTEIPEFTISQEDIDNRIYIPPDGENYISDMSLQDKKTS